VTSRPFFYSIGGLSHLTTEKHFLQAESQGLLELLATVKSPFVEQLSCLPSWLVS
jgi:hypothetical protein